jgi:hypothetical protein
MAIPLIYNFIMDAKSKVAPSMEGDFGKNLRVSGMLAGDSLLKTIHGIGLTIIYGSATIFFNLFNSTLALHLKEKLSKGVSEVIEGGAGVSRYTLNIVCLLTIGKTLKSACKQLSKEFKEGLKEDVSKVSKRKRAHNNEKNKKNKLKTQTFTKALSLLLKYQ